MNSCALKILSYGKKLAEREEFECRIVELYLLEENPKAKLLDLGCGDGSTTLRAARKIGTDSVFGIEIFAEDINKAKANGVDVRSGDLNQKLPFEDETFDVVIASHVIEHLANTDIFIREIYRVLKVGGYAIIATPNLAAFFNILYLLAGKQPVPAEVSDEALVGTWSPKGNHVNMPGRAHRRLFTMGALRGLLKYYGLEIEREMGTGYFPLPGFWGRVMARIDKWHATNIVIKARKG